METITIKTATPAGAQRAGVGHHNEASEKSYGAEMTFAKPETDAHG
jgi:hypothetical protein